MTVRELKQKLEEDASPDEQVYIILSNDNPLTDGCEVKYAFDLFVDDDSVDGFYLQQN